MKKPPIAGMAGMFPTREACVLEFGPRCAAWIVRKFRRRLRRTGSVTFRAPVDAEIPDWFEIALAYLERRPERWAVVRRRTESGRSFVLARVLPQLPASLRAN